ncbi:MAG: DUF1735 domain-containing protein [Prolixibacteraceae bacterium]
MPEAARNPNVVTLLMSDSVQNIVYGANFGGYGYPSSDIQIQFEVNESMVDSFNLANGTNYPILPAASYSLEKLSALILKGKISTEPLLVKINPIKNLAAFKKYLLPISIKVANQKYPVNDKLKTSYFVIEAMLDFADYPNYDRSGWSILGVSSEEPAEGPVNGGLGISAIDNNLESFWHSKWAGGYGTPPHWIAIDMGETRVVHGISIFGRQSDNLGKPKDIIISVSMNGTDWEDVDSVQLENSNQEQRFFVSKMLETRYIKITVLSTYGNVLFTHLDEVNAF